MRQVNFIHLLWLIAGSLEVYDQFAQPVPQQRTRTGINQDQLAAGIDQVGINRGDDRQALMVLSQSGLYLLWRTVQQQSVNRQAEHAIRQGCDFIAAQHDAIKTRRGGFHLRRGGQGLQRHNGQRRPQQVTFPEHGDSLLSFER
ncbi:hypothetical protein D3C72_1807200 [compost metagenome]